MFAVLHSDINSLKSGLIHLTGQPYCKKGRSAKVKGDGIINLFLRNYLANEYRSCLRTLDIREGCIIFAMSISIEGKKFYDIDTCSAYEGTPHLLP
jgi:hypothetical protein